MRLILLGANNPDSVRLIDAVKQVRPEISTIAFLDNDKEKQGIDFMGIPIIGGSECVAALSGSDTEFVNLISSSTWIRHETTQEILLSGGKLGRLVHPSIDDTYANLQEGVYIKESIIQTNTTIGRNAVVSSGCVVSHETEVGESSFIGPGACIGGKCKIGTGAYIGMNATILPRLRIGNWATIGGGSVVVRDVPDHAVVAGNPARRIRSRAKQAGTHRTQEGRYL